MRNRIIERKPVLGRIQREALQNVLLQEYGATSSAIADANKRLETIRGLYLAAAFAIIGSVVSSQPNYVSGLIERVRTDHYLLTGVLFLPFLNSILLIYVVSLMHFILAAAQYNTYQVGPRLSRIVKAPVLQFDIWTSENKQIWVFLRTASGVLYYIFAMFASIGLLFSFRSAGQFRLGFVPGVSFVISLSVVSFSVVVGLSSLALSKHFHNPGKKPLRLRLFYLPTVGLTAVLYIILAWLS